jgi:anti-anti-sigma regulatory factor
MHTLERGVGGETLVRFSGVLDATSAREVTPVLGVVPSGKVTLDFSQAIDVDHCGLAALVAEIVQCECGVVLRGLRTSQIRMLKYLGLDIGRFGLASGGAAE